ncbi:MAG: PIN domain-containing protein [Armatimonadota bacterium]
MLDEFQEKLVVKFAFEPRQARKAADEIRNCSQVVTIYNTLNVVTADPDDDKILECAVVGGATHIITGDRHLLSLGSYQNISIVNAADFLTLLSAP